MPARPASTRWTGGLWGECRGRKGCTLQDQDDGGRQADEVRELLEQLQQQRCELDNLNRRIDALQRELDDRLDDETIRLLGIALADLVRPRAVDAGTRRIP